MKQTEGSIVRLSKGELYEALSRFIALKTNCVVHVVGAFTTDIPYDLENEETYLKVECTLTKEGFDQ